MKPKNSVKHGIQHFYFRTHPLIHNDDGKQIKLAVEFYQFSRLVSPKCLFYLKISTLFNVYVKRDTIAHGLL